MSEVNQSPSFGDVLKGPPPTPPQETASEASPEPIETEASPEAQATPAVPKAAEVAKAPEPARPVKTETDWQREIEGLKNATIAERRKRQEMEAQLQRFQQPEPQSYLDSPEQYVDKQVGSVKKEVQDHITSMSEIMARQAHPDFEEKYRAFQDAALQNPALMDMVLGDRFPGEAAYQMGKQVMFNQKYGASVDDMYKNIRAEAEAELRPKIREELEVAYLGKVHQRANNPTNISSARVANGDAQSDWQPTSFGQVLKRRR